MFNHYRFFALYLGMAFTLCLSAYGQELAKVPISNGQLFQYKEGYQVVDSEGNPVLDGFYEQAFEKEAVLVLEQKGKVGLWSMEQQKWLLPLRYALDQQRSEHPHFLWMAKKKDSLAVYTARLNDEGGVWTFSKVIDRGNGQCFVQTEDGKWGVLEGMGSSVHWGLKPQCENLIQVEIDGQEYLRVQQQGKIGIYRQGELLVPIAYEDVKGSGAPEHFLVKENGLWGTYCYTNHNYSMSANWEEVELLTPYVERKGKKIFMDEPEGTADCHYLFKAKRGEAWGVFDSQLKKMIVPPKYEAVSSKLILGYGLLLSFQGSQLGLVNLQDGKEVLPPTMQRISPFTKEALLVKKMGKFGLLSLDNLEWRRLKGIFGFLDQQWSNPGEFLLGSASIRVSGEHAWVPMPLRKRIVRYNLSTGKEEGIIQSNGFNRDGQFVLDEDRVFFGDGHGGLHCYLKNGQEAWQFKASDNLAFAPIIGRFGANGEKQVVIVDVSGKVYALHVTTGDVKWGAKVNWPKGVTGHGTVSRSAEGGQEQLLLHTFQESSNQEEGCAYIAYVLRFHEKQASGGEPLHLGCGNSAQQLLSLADSALSLYDNQLRIIREDRLLQMNTSLGSGLASKNPATYIQFDPIGSTVYALHSSEQGGDVLIEANQLSVMGRVSEDSRSAPVFEYALSGITAPAFVADILGKGSPQVGWVSEEGLLLLLENDGSLAGLYRLPTGVKAMPWVGDTNGDGRAEVLMVDVLGNATLFTAKNPGKVYWGEWGGNPYNQWRMR